MMEAMLTKVQKATALILAVMLVVIMLLSTMHLGVLIGQEIMKPPRFLIPVQGLLEIFGYFLLVLIGVELIETLKAYVKKDVVHIRVVLEVALIAMARKVIIEEPNSIPSLTLFGIAALILALGVTPSLSDRRSTWQQVMRQRKTNCWQLFIAQPVNHDSACTHSWLCSVELIRIHE